MNKFIVDIDSAGSRLDKFLAKNGFGFALAQKILRKKDVKINGKKFGAERRLEEGDQVHIFGNYEPSPGSEARAQTKQKSKVSEEKIKIVKNSIIFQDDNLLAIDKPAGIAVQAGNPNDFSIDAALPYLKLEKEETPRLVHRLDRDTSGILLLARNRKTATILSEGFKNKTIKKTYLALIKGFPKQNEGTISMPLLEKSFGDYKKVFKSDLGKEAVTHYKVLRKSEDCSLVELKPVTGRMHQLRVHCKEIGHSIVGDGKYGKRVTGDKISEIEGRNREMIENKKNNKNRLCLHSFTLEIDDFFGKKLLITSEQPHFARALNLI
ncbi:MAG: 23S rRNA pseudouridine955/2504/2580 synthase [Rickettsiales bacterium]|jgi:23S rRNA pseudouridine955/2504/2580 synthase